MQELRDKLVSLPTMALLFAGGRYIFNTDVCNVRIGFLILEQGLNGTTKPVECLSRFLNTAEQS